VTTAAPTQVLSSRLPATPEQVWARVRHSGFIADYLCAKLPAADWTPGCRLLGTGPDGAPLAITVVEVLAPCSLLLQVTSGPQPLALQLSIAACAEGSRLTLTHAGGYAPGKNSEPGANRGDAAGSPPGAAPGAGPDAAPDLGIGDTNPTPGWARSLAQRLAAPPGVALSASALGSQAALAAARAYLADTATLVAALRGTVPQGQGHVQPADGRFSLAQHVWHLVDVEQFGWARRFNRLLTTRNPLLPGVDGDRLAVERRYQQRRWQPAAARFVRQRQHTLAALAGCTPATLLRPVRFSGQATTGADMLAALLAHDHEHRLDLSGLLPAH
jgi:uncharacterized damage-inducible protein DinB